MRSLLTADVMTFIEELGLTPEQSARFNAFATEVRLQDDRIAFAARLLAARTPRPEVRDRLMVRHELSRRQAYRVISDALHLKQNCAIEMAQMSGVMKS